MKVEFAKRDFEEAWKKFKDNCKEAAITPDVKGGKILPIVYPLREVNSTEINTLTPALLWTVLEDEVPHAVIVYYDPDDKTIKTLCGDKIFNLKTREESIESARKLYNDYRKVFEKEGLKREFLIPEDKVMQFYRCDEYWNEGKCVHTELVKHLIGTISDRVTSSPKQKLEQVAQQFYTDSSDTVESTLEEQLVALAFRANTIVEGEQGSGKTYAALTVAQKLMDTGKANDIVVVQGDNSVEGVDLLGYWIKAQDGSFVWKDGGITEAFRKASKGQKVILIIDEILRIRTKERDLLVRALTVWKDGKYRLRTGRVLGVEDGVAQEEILEVPRENLWVIGTTNIGSQFAVDEYDPAFAERFVLLRADTTEADLRRILTRKCDEMEFPPVVVGLLINFWEKCRKVYNAGDLAGVPTTRTLVRALEVAPSKTVKGVKEGLWLQRYLWIGRDSLGYPVKEQEELLRGLLEGIFK